MDKIYAQVAPRSLFTFPPAPLPTTVPPPTHDTSIAYPFNISPETYNTLLSINLPITIAVVYATTVVFLNRINKQRNNKPWPLSRHRAFFYFVITHNVALAVYSGWTAVGMYRAAKNTVPAWDGDFSLAKLADSLCKPNGPRGFGDAVTYSPTSSEWTTWNRGIKLLHGKPDGTDVGRLWNEGLGYYGWLFYLSKFYEVIDTLIILAKGKKSSLLQTYHHAGAMLCMWAGIRYMSLPIWMFVQINSFVHMLMYTYYTLSALGFRVPMVFKRSLTTMQIMQMGFGVFYASMHLFVAYDVPMETPYLLAQRVSTAFPSVTSAVAAAASASTGTWLKKIALRAAGEEGLAGNVGGSEGALLFNNAGFSPFKPANAREEIRYRLEHTRVHCIDTSGQVFAILLNVVYLMPLTYLFVRFFIRSYLRRVGRREAGKGGSALRASSTDAVKAVEREIRKALSVSQTSSFSDHEASSKAPDSSAPRSPGTPTEAVTPPTVKAPNGNAAVEEAAWFGSPNGKADKKGKKGKKAKKNDGPEPSANGTPRDTPSPSTGEAQRSAEEAVRRAYEAAEAASRQAAEEETEADSIQSVETTLTAESAGVSQTEARNYEVSGVDEALDTQEQEAEHKMQPHTD